MTTPFSTIRMLQTVEIPLEPLFKGSQIYHVSNAVARLLIDRGYAEEVLEVKREITKTSKK